MTISATAALWFLPFALPICLWVAWNDLKFMKIPNKAVLALLGIFAVVGLIALPSLGEYLWRYVHVIVVLVIGFVLNLSRAVGAGDAKFAAVMAPFVALGDLRMFMFLLAAVTIAAFITHRVFRRLPAVTTRFPDWQSWDSPKFPMGLALGPTLAIYLGLGVVFGS